MVDLFAPEQRAALIARLRRLTPDARPRWGSMTPPQLLAHLIAAFAISSGAKAVQVRRGFLATRLGRALALRLPIPRGRIRAPADFHQTAPGDFEADRERVIAAIERFAEDPAARGGVSPIFGRLSARQWARLHATHLQHHLTQFGV